MAVLLRLIKKKISNGKENSISFGGILQDEI
jgi:hypothetical protein